MDNEVEIWRPHHKYPGYLFSTAGYIISRLTHKPMKPGWRGKGYSGTVLTDTKGKRVTVAVHRLLAEVFIEKPSEQHNQINHINGIKTDNRIENLEWVTPSENMMHKLNVLNKKNLALDKHPMTSFSVDQIKEIRSTLSKGVRGGAARLAKKYGVCKSTISKIKLRKNWASI